MALKRRRLPRRGLGPWGRGVQAREPAPPFLPVSFLLVHNSSAGPLPTFLVAGGSLAFGTLLCAGIVLR